MKKVILVCLSVLMTAGLANVNAQTIISGGIKAEANMSNFILNDLDFQTSKLNVGANLGGFMKIDLHENFAIQPEMMFFFRNSKMETGSYEDDFQQFGVQIPIYAVGQMNLGTGKGYIGVGPYVGLGFSAKMKDADTDLYEKINDEAAMNRWDFGIGAMVGYEFGNGIQINAGYQIGLIDQLDTGKDNATMLNQGISLGIGYRF
jgi:hypothetical protein